MRSSLLLAALLLAALAAPLAAQQCAWAFSPSPIPTLPAGGGTGTLTLTSSPYFCSWVYGTDSTWITVSAGAAGTGAGGGSVNWTAAANLTAAPRTGNIVIYDGYTTYYEPITEAAAVCTLSPPSGAGILTGIAATTGSLALQTGCVWNAFSNASWITVGDPTVGYATGTGNGSFNYSIAANSCYAPRTAGITVEAGWAAPQAAVAGSQQYTVTQSGSDSNLTLSATNLTLTAAGGTGTVQVTTAATCAWTATSNVSWMNITNISVASGNGFVAYQVLPNTSVARTGMLQIGSQTFTVTEQAVPAPVPAVTGVTSAASFTVGPVSPGDIVSVFGSDLGPASGVGMQLNSAGTALTTILGGTQVFFDAAAAALTYVGAGQVNAIVPYEVAGKTTTQLTVEYQGGTSAPVSLNVQAATPAVFSQDFTGQGNGAILNQDNSLNGKSRPAARGTVVQIFLTGGGVTNPASTDGWITTFIGGQLPLLETQPVTVTIGGVASPQINYSGGAPGAVAGLTQINAVVPDNVMPGSALPLVVGIGTWQSQSGITIAVE